MPENTPNQRGFDYNVQKFKQMESQDEDPHSLETDSMREYYDKREQELHKNIQKRIGYIIGAALVVLFLFAFVILR